MRLPDAAISAFAGHPAVVSWMRHGYNVRAAAQALGMHRTQLYRKLRQLGIEIGRQPRPRQE